MIHLCDFSLPLHSRKYYRTWRMRVIGCIRVPCCIEQGGLLRYSTSLNVHRVDEGVRLIWSAPITSPDEIVVLRKVTEKRKVTLPRGFTIDDLNDVAREAIVVHSDYAEPTRALIKQGLLPRLAPICLKHHQVDAHHTCISDDVRDRLPGDRFQQVDVIDSSHAVKSRISRNHVGVKICHVRLTISLCRETSPCNLTHQFV